MFRRAPFVLKTLCEFAALVFLAALATGAGAEEPTVSPAGAPSAPAAAGTPQVLREETDGHLRIAMHGEKLSVYALRVDAHLLFTRLAKQANAAIIVDDTVSRTITINISEKSLREVLASIAAAYGFSFNKVGGVYLVSEGIPKGPSSYLVSDIAAVTTKYVQAPNARALLPVFLQDHVKVNPVHNSVILSGPAPVLRKFAEDVAQFDVPAAQIMIDVLVVELTDVSRDEFEFATRWANAGKAASSDAATGDVSFNTITGLAPDFFVRLQALVTKGKARVHARPRIATVSGVQASIFIGFQQFLRTPVQLPSEGGDDRLGGRQSISIDAGVRLTITPYTGGAGEIIAEINPEVSTLSAPDPVTGLPDKSTRQARTTVRVRDGETVVIGGLFQEELRAVRGKVPVLGDIPLIGHLFRSKDINKTRTELVIFITPRLLSQTGHLPAGEEQQLKEQYLKPEAPEGRE